MTLWLPLAVPLVVILAWWPESYDSIVGGPPTSHAQYRRTTHSVSYWVLGFIQSWARGKFGGLQYALCPAWLYRRYAAEPVESMLKES
jgi:hypothetical protein